MDTHTWSFLIVAAGSGSRMGGTQKQFRKLGSIPVWKWSARIAEKLWNDGKIIELIIVVPSEYCSIIKGECNFKVPTYITSGGKIRSESVIKGLEICSGSHVLVHDGARPFLTENLCVKIMQKADNCGSAVPLIDSSDSLKKQSGEKLISVDRKEYFRTQTPQAFEKKPLLEAVKHYGANGTDEASAWIGEGHELYSVDGEETNFKITTPFDWLMATSIVNSNTELRMGHGYDIHKLVPGRKLILAGKEVKNAKLGLLGHSDADIVTHTVMDAILGAAGEPDIGIIFPASDDKWKDAVSTELLASVVERVRLKGWVIEWVDVTLEAQTPKLGQMVQSFISSLAPYLIERDGNLNFNMKVKSGEGCGSVGRCECMVCHGVATLSRNKLIMEAF